MANPKPKTEHLKKTQFKKGESGNEAGKPQNRMLRLALSKKKLKDIEDLTKEEVKKIDIWVLSMSTSQLIEIAKDDDVPSYFRAQAAALLSDLKNGRTAVVDRLRDRYIGDTKTTRIEGITEAPAAQSPIVLNITQNPEEVQAQLDALQNIAGKEDETPKVEK